MWAVLGRLAPAVSFVAAGDSFFAVYLALQLIFAAGLPVSDLRRHASFDDEGIVVVVLITLTAILLSIMSIFAILNRGSAPDPLSDYLGSLARIAELDPRLALPGHGERILDPAGRANEIAEHHEDRLRRTLAELGPEPRSGYDVSRTLFPDALAPPLRRFAVAETLAHLEHLVHADRATRVAEDGRTTYAA